MKNLFVLMVFAVFASNAFTQGANSFIKVKGEATVKAVPEKMQVYIPLEARATSYESCNEELKGTFNALTKALQNAGFEEKELKSDRLSITEAYEYQSGQRVKVGYSGNIQLYIETRHTQENLSRVMNTLQQDAFKFGYSIDFALSESQKDTLKKEALEASVADAREKAEILAGAAGLKLGPVYEINFEFESNDSSPLMWHKMSLAEASRDAQSDISLNPKDQEIRKEVGIIWQLIDPR